MEQDKPINPPTPALPQPEEMLITPEASPKKTKLTFILLGVFIIFLIGAGTFFVSKSLRRPAVAPQPTPPIQKACTLDAKICPDGSSVGRTGPNCEFAPCPTSKPSDETANWKTYTNITNGYTVQVPKNWAINEWDKNNPKGVFLNVPGEVTFTPPDEVGKELKTLISIVSLKKPEFRYSLNTQTQFDEWFAIPAATDVRRLVKVGNTKVDDINAVKFISTTLPGDATESFFSIVTWFRKEGANYYIEFGGDENIVNSNIKIYNQILSTFKFLDETTVPCGGWDTLGDVVCECSGQIEKYTCPPNSVCDSGVDTCHGSCGECKCYNGPAKNGIEIPCNGRDKYFK